MAKKAIKPTEQPVPALGHNSDLTDDALIAENFKLEDLIKAAQQKFDEWAKPHKARIAEIESALRARLLERGADFGEFGLPLVGAQDARGGRRWPGEGQRRPSRRH